MNIAISVIIPIYKAENYIHKCIQSFISQDFTNFELILIDDGSPDKSGEICDYYKNIDNRICVIHKKNEGVSAARQTGIDHAKGKYIIQADPDDWVEKNMLNCLFNKAESSNADIVICDMWVDYSNGSFYKLRQKPTDLSHNSILNDLFHGLHGSMCNKLIRKELFSQYNIKFLPTISYCEDWLVCIKLYKNPIKTIYYEQAFYHYTQDINENSIVKNYTLKSYYQDKFLFDAVVKELNNYPQAPVNYKTLIAVNLFQRGFQANTFSNIEFKEKFLIYKPYIICMPVSIKKLLFILSYTGHYKSTYFIYQLLLKIKRLLNLSPNN